jgi:hypothetical protein
MRGMRSEDLVAIVDFIYLGETAVNQDNLENFFVIAEELKLKGLKSDHTEDGAYKKRQKPKSAKIESTKNKRSTSKYETEGELVSESILKQESMEDLDKQITSSETFLAEKSIKKKRSTPKYEKDGEVASEIMLKQESVEDLDKQIKSMMVPSETILANGRRASTCQVCGKEGNWNVIKNHIENNHIEGMAHPCKPCGKTFKSRPSLKTHDIRHHQDSKLKLAFMSSEEESN